MLDTNINVLMTKKNKLSTLLKLSMLFLLSTLSFFAQEKVGPIYIKSVLERDGVFKAPKYEFIDTYTSYDNSKSFSNIKGLFMEGLSSVKTKNKKTKVFCWYGEPKNLKKGEQRPAVVLMHGGGGDAFITWVDKWVERGYIAIAIALEGQVPDKDAGFKYAGPKRDNFFNDVDSPLQEQWFYHAVADGVSANSLLRDPNFTTHVDVNHIGITGISWGGILTNVVTGIDNRFDFSIPVYGCGYLYETPLYSPILKRMGQEKTTFYMQNWEPSLYVPLQKCPTLFVNGTNDKHFTMNAFTKTYQTSNNEKYLRIEKEMRHGHYPGWMPVEIYDFANYVTGFDNNATQPLKFKSQKISKKGLLTYKYKFRGGVDEAYLLYTKDTINWAHNTYKWISKPATLKSKSFSGSITVQVPKDAQAYFINIRNKEKIYSSPMVIPE